MNKSKLWTKDFIIITLTTFFVFLTFYLLMTTLTIYAIKQFSASQSQAGLASSLFVIGALVSRVLTGKYIEVIGRKKLLYGSLLLFLLASLFYFPADRLSLLLAVRFVHGTAFGVLTMTIATEIMDIIPAERRGEGTSYFSLSTTLATAIGPFLGLFITQHADFDMIFVACTLFSVLSIIVILFANIPEAQLTTKQREALKGFRLEDFFEKKAIPISTILLIMGIAYSGILSYLNSYAIEIHLTDAAGFFFVVYAVVILSSRPFTGRLLDRKGPKHRVGLTTSTFFLCMDVGMGAGPLLVGIVVPIAGFRGMYMALAVIVFLSIFLYYFVHGKKASLAEAERSVYPFSS